MNTAPLVSILIPACNRPEFFEPALRSALEQIYENIEIIICDDSINNNIFDIVKRYIPLNSSIHYYKNEKPLPGRGVGNAQKCLELSSGEYINYLFDDDLFHREKIVKMLPYLINNQNISLVTSHRIIIDEKGNHMAPLPSSVRLFDKATALEGNALIRFMLKNLLNVIGEPTTVLFRKKDIENKFGFYSGKQYSCLTDLAMWIQLLSKGNGVYLPDTLSYFRVHASQNSQNSELMLLGTVESYSLIKAAFENKILSGKEEYQDCLINFLHGNLRKICMFKRKNIKNGSMDSSSETLSEIYDCFENALKDICMSD